MLETVSLFDSMELDNTNHRVVSRRALALAHTRVETNLGRFLRGARNEDEFLERLGLVQDDFTGYITTASDEVGHEHPEHIAAALTDHYKLAAGVQFVETPAEKQEKEDEEEDARESKIASQKRSWGRVQSVEAGVNMGLPGQVPGQPGQPAMGGCPCGGQPGPDGRCPQCGQGGQGGMGQQPQPAPGVMAGKQGSPLVNNPNDVPGDSFYNQHGEQDADPLRNQQGYIRPGVPKGVGDRDEGYEQIPYEVAPDPRLQRQHGYGQDVGLQIAPNLPPVNVPPGAPIHQGAKQAAPFEVQHPDNPDPYVFDDNVPPEAKQDLQKRFDYTPVVKHPDQAGTYIQDPGNWWDGARHVTDLGDRQYGYEGYAGPKRFDQTGNDIGPWNGLGPVDQHGVVDADPYSDARYWREQDRAAQEEQRLQEEADHEATWRSDYGYTGAAQNPADQDDDSSRLVTCPECGGDGKQAGVNRCGKCKGNGKVPNFGDSLLDATFAKTAEEGNTDLGGPEPKMDKRKWTPSNPAKPKSDGIEKDITEPIKATNEGDLKEIGDAKEEKLPSNSDDAGFDGGGEDFGPHTKTFGDGGQTDPVTRESISHTNPLLDMLLEQPSDLAVEKAFASLQ